MGAGTAPDVAEYLLTPGPLTTALSTRRAMLRDWGSRDRPFVELTERVADAILGTVEGRPSHVAVFVQGSGTFAVEAALRTFVSPGDRVLVLANGAYGDRMAEICRVTDRRHAVERAPEGVPVDPARVARRLRDEPDLTCVSLVHCETSSGVLNPLERIADIVAAHGRRLLVDAMSTLGGLPISVQRTPIDVAVASANKCLEGVPGVAFVIARREVLERCEGNAGSLALDLFAQWTHLARTGQWRFTPPTHVMAALDDALQRLAAEGGVPARGARYRRNLRALVAGMRALGFRTLLDDAVQAPIIVTFRSPRDGRFDFEAFYEALRRRGFVIYPGKLTAVPSFRIGCIGDLGEAEIVEAVAAVAAVAKAQGFSPAP